MGRYLSLPSHRTGRKGGTGGKNKKERKEVWKKNKRGRGEKRTQTIFFLSISRLASSHQNSKSQGEKNPGEEKRKKKNHLSQPQLIISKRYAIVAAVVQERGERRKELGEEENQRWGKGKKREKRSSSLSSVNHSSFVRCPAGSKGRDEKKEGGKGRARREGRPVWPAPRTSSSSSILRARKKRK